MERTAFLYLCGLLMYGAEASDSSCRLKDLTMQPQCCSPKTYIEVKFFLRLRSNGGCDSTEYLDQGIRFEVGIVNSNQWMPIRYYTATTATGPSSLVKLVNNSHVEAIALNYNSTFPLQVCNSTEPIPITEYICGEEFVTPFTRFRWFQRYSGASLADRNTWSLDNLTVTLWNGSCHNVIMEEDFENMSRIMTNFAENTGGIVVEPPCGETASGKALYFQGNISEGVSRRRLKMHRTNFTSPTTVCHTPLRAGSGCSLDSAGCTSDTSVCSLGTFDCSCTVGYRREGFVCADVNECDEDLHRCSQLCVNSEGTYHCACYPGYRMNDDRLTCSDIDECTMGLNNCSGGCRNTGGSFECLCSPGFLLEEDGVTCTPTVASVGFERGAYSTHEGEKVEVCVLVQNATLDRTVDVSLSTADQTATAPQDYIGMSTQLLFTPSETRQCVNITLLDDSIVEERETFALELASSELGILLSPNKTTITIQDTDRAEVGFMETVIRVSERNRSVELCAVVQDATLERGVTVTLSTRGGSAAAGDDYTAIAVDLHFNSARYSQCTAISLVDDFTLEGVEMFTVNLNTSDAMVTLMPAEATVIITDNDYVDVGLAVAAYTVSENDRIVEVCVSIVAGSLGVPVNVLLATTDGTATASSDYHSLATLVSFDSSISHVCANISVEDDQLTEQEEQFSVAISSNESHSLVRTEIQEAVVTILDNDGIALGFEMESYGVRENESPLEICTVMVGSGSLDRDVEITMATLSGTALASLDYTATTTQLTFVPNDERLCVEIAIIDDQLVEETEELQVRLISSSSITIFLDSTTVSILDNDRVMIGFENSNYSVRESEGSVDVCTVLSGSLEKTIAIGIHTESGTATEGSDYSAASTELRFSPNTTRSCTTILINEDNLFEEEESFSVRLKSTDPAVLLSPAVAAVIIIDSGGTSDVINVKQQIAAGQLNATNAVNILDDLLNNQLSDGQTATAAFSMAFVEAATILLDKIRSESEEEVLNKEEVTAIASQLLTTLDRFASKSFSPDDGGELQTENLKLQVQIANLDDNLMIVGIEEDGNEIVLPPEIIRRTGNREVRVASYYFRNMTGILPDTSPGLNGSRLVSPVISAALGCGGSMCGRSNTDNPVRVVLTHEDYQTTLQEPSCVFWEFVNEGDSVNGRWSEQGCEVDEEESNTTTTVCLCNHLTHFAILLSPRLEVSERDAAALTIIGYVGVSVSLTCLLLTIAAFLFLRSLWGMRTYIHINLCASLFVAQLIFVAGVDKTSNEKACQAIAVLLHYFFLVTFMWMLMEGVVLYVALVRVFVKKQKYYIAAFTIVSYGLPALYMGVTVPLGFLLENGPHYAGSDAGCWLRYDTHFIWAFIAPVILIILVNTGFFIMAICIMYRHDKRRLQKSKLQTAKHWLKSCISLVIIMGISWIVGVLAFHQALLAVSYIFTIFVAFQGLFIFILFVPVSKQVRESYRKWWRSKVAGSDFLSQYFSEEKQRRFTRTTSLGSSFKASMHQHSVVDCPTASQADGTLDENKNVSVVLQTDGCDGDTKTPPPLPAEEKMRTELGSTEEITAANPPLENNADLHKDAEECTLPQGDDSQNSDEDCTAV